MSVRFWTFVVVAVLFCWAGGEQVSRAEWIFFGPTPYRSRADSPFPVDGSNPGFFLEDFEDGLLNTPGIQQRNLYPVPGDIGLAVVQSPAVHTDSVDGDDGLVDGFGREGHSLRSGFQLTLPMNPPAHQFLIEFEFDELRLGFLPNSFGIVWTDGPASSALGLRIVAADGTEYVTEGISDLGDSSREGEASEDIFVGVSGIERIRTVTVIGGARGELSSPGAIEIDHVQYGYIVPEPSTLVLGLLLITLMSFHGMCQRPSKSDLSR